MRAKWAKTTLDELVASGIVLLGRGNVISKNDMEKNPGLYPVYSSAQNNDGRIGSYNNFMFDEELITWSIDGGGYVFYRPHHKFSVTNICGYLRILDDTKFLYPFLAAVLQALHSQQVFDWQNKAHPSVIRKLYTEIPLPPLAEQKRIVHVMASVDAYIAALQQQSADARTTRNAVLHKLLTAGGDDWTEATLGQIAEFVNGYPFKPKDLGEEGTPVIRIKQLLDPNEACDKTLVSAPDRCVLQPGDIVFSWSGTLAVRVWDRERAFLNQHLFRVVEKKGVMHEWLPLVLEHSIKDLSEMTHGTTMKHLRKQTLLPHTIHLPPLSEQKRIVDTVSSTDDVIRSSERALANAQRLRLGLLSDLLSGTHKIPESYDRLLSAA
jgi:restriction endonuclease S subunit